MTQAKSKFSSFEEYLEYDNGTDGRYELIDGELVELPPESEPNDFTATWLQFELAKLTGLRLIKIHSCQVQVPVIKQKDPANRFPDLVVLREEHLELTQRQLTITMTMPPPRLVAEVVSPGGDNRDRDYDRKREQYSRLGIPEYWLIDPEQQVVVVLHLEQGKYSEVGTFREQERIVSPTFKELELTAGQVLSAGASAGEERMY